MKILELVQNEIDGKYYVTVLMFGEPIQTYQLSREATQEELDRLSKTCSDRMSKAIESEILYGRKERKDHD